MKNIKTLTIGIVIGAVAALSISALAEYIVNPNPYPIKVNGKEVQIEGYNINDNTYFKLRDVGDKIGFSVDFQDGAIVVSTDEFQTEPTSAPVNEPTASTQATPNPKLGEDNIAYYTEHGYKFTSDGLPIYVLEDGNGYVSSVDIEDVYDCESYGYDWFGGKLYGNGGIRDEDVLLSDIPTAPKNQSYILAEYYDNNIRLIFQENCK